MVDFTSVKILGIGGVAALFILLSLATVGLNIYNIINAVNGINSFPPIPICEGVGNLHNFLIGVIVASTLAFVPVAVSCCNSVTSGLCGGAVGLFTLVLIIVGWLIM